jgi:diguanylate cyclase
MRCWIQAGKTPKGKPRVSAPIQDDARSSAEHLRFVKRMRGMRSFGLALGFVCIGSVLWVNQASAGVWVLLAISAFVWPQIAYQRAIRSPDRVTIEHRNLMVDSALGGAWIAVMQLNLLPSILLLTMLFADKVAVGGAWFALRASAVLAASCGLVWMAIGMPVRIETPLLVIVGCVPLLLGYSVALSSMMYGLARKVARQNKRLAQISSTDDLTGLANRRQGFAAANAILARHRRAGASAVLIVLDLDHFKRINDTYGHPFGDEVLKIVAETLRECTRETDSVARYGGDEFMVVLSDTNLVGAQGVADRISKQLASTELKAGLYCSASIGLAELRPDMPDVDAWIHQADAALYRAKADGRSRATINPKIAA